MSMGREPPIAEMLTSPLQGAHEHLKHLQIRLALVGLPSI